MDIHFLVIRGPMESFLLWRSFLKNEIADNINTRTDSKPPAQLCRSLLSICPGSIVREQQLRVHPVRS